MHLHSTADGQSRTRYAAPPSNTALASPPTVPPYPSPANPDWRLIVEMPDYSNGDAGFPPVSVEFDLRDLPPFTVGDESANVVLDLVDEYLAEQSTIDERGIPGQVVVTLAVSGWWINGSGGYQSFVSCDFVGRDAIAVQLGLQATV